MWPWVMRMIKNKKRARPDPHNDQTESAPEADAYNFGRLAVLSISSGREDVPRFFEVWIDIGTLAANSPDFVPAAFERFSLWEGEGIERVGIGLRRPGPRPWMQVGEGGSPASSSLPDGAGSGGAPHVVW